MNPLSLAVLALALVAFALPSMCTPFSPYIGLFSPPFSAGSKLYLATLTESGAPNKISSNLAEYGIPTTMTTVAANSTVVYVTSTSIRNNVTRMTINSITAQNGSLVTSARLDNFAPENFFYNEYSNKFYGTAATYGSGGVSTSLFQIDLDGQVSHLQTFPGQVSALSGTMDGADQKLYLLVTLDSMSYGLWTVDLDTLKVVNTLKFPNINQIPRMIFAGDAKVLYATYHDSDSTTVAVLDLATGAPIKTLATFKGLTTEREVQPALFFDPLHTGCIVGTLMKSTDTGLEPWWISVDVNNGKTSVNQWGFGTLYGLLSAYSF